MEAYCGQNYCFLSKTLGQKVQGRSERKGVGCAAGSWMLEDTSESDGLGAVGVICRIAGLGSSYSWAPERCWATHTLTQTQTHTHTHANALMQKHLFAQRVTHIHRCLHTLVSCPSRWSLYLSLVLCIHHKSTEKRVRTALYYTHPCTHEQRMVDQNQVFQDVNWSLFH